MGHLRPYISVTLLRAVVTVLVVFAIAGFLLTLVLGFEEPNSALLLLSSGLMLTAVLAVFAHLALTSELNPSEKRIWLARLTGRKAPWAFSDYLNCEDLRATAVSLDDDR